METIFPYRKEHSPIFGSIYRPKIPVELIWGSERKIQLMYLDSGADITLLSKSVGDLLKFEMIDDVHEMKGVIADISLPVIIKNIKIKLCDIKFPIRVAWALIETPLLLGRMDVFDKFEIVFMQKEKKVVIYFDDDEIK